MATDATLTRIEKNSVLSAIQLFQFDPAEFEWVEIKSEEWSQHFTVLKLVHRGTGYYITFGGLQIMYSPGDGRKVDGEIHEHVWDNKRRALNSWLQRLRDEVEAPDLWARSGNYRTPYPPIWGTNHSRGQNGSK
jgi:hypothetical protein